MPVAFDSSANGSVVASSLTYSHTCTGTNLILFVLARVVNTNTVTGITYNSIAMTQIGSPVTNAANDKIYLFYLIAPATGANNVVVSVSASDTIRSASASYTGAKQSGQPDNSITTTQNTSTSITNSLTTNADGCWVVAGTANDVGVASDGTNYKNRNNSQGTGIGDSNSSVSPPTSLSQTVNAGGSANWAIIQASIAPNSFVSNPKAQGYSVFL